MESNRPPAEVCPHCGQWHERSLGRCPVTGASAPPPAPRATLVGQTIGGRYLARKLVGVGSLGPVYAGEHIDFQRPVVIRVLEPEYAPAEAAARVFFGEARQAWAMAHPNVCEVLDVGTSDAGSPYVIYEKLAGETLARRLARGGRLSVGAAIDVMLQLLSGLGFAHARGIVHRDVRPENVFLAERRGCRPLVKVLDFGLGKLVSPSRMGQRWHDDAHPPSMPFYLPPERARGEQGTDDRGDLFAAGVVFYEMLTGTRPFRAASFNDLMLALARGEFVPATIVRKELPAPIDVVIAKALSVSRESRYGSADQWQDDLQALYELARYEQMARGEEFSAVHAQPAAPDAPDPYDDQGEASVLEATRVGRAADVAFPLAPLAPLAPSAPLAAPPARPDAQSPSQVQRAAARRSAPPDSEPPETATAAGLSPPAPPEPGEFDDDHAPTIPPPAGFVEGVIDSEPSLVTTQARAPAETAGGALPPPEDDEPNTMTGAAASPVDLGAPPPDEGIPDARDSAPGVPYVAVPPAVEASRPARQGAAPPPRAPSRRPLPAPTPRSEVDDDDEPDDRTEKVRLTPELIEKLRAMKAGEPIGRSHLTAPQPAPTPQRPPAASSYDEEERPTRVEKAPDDLRGGATLKSRPSPTRRTKT